MFTTYGPWFGVQVQRDPRDLMDQAASGSVLPATLRPCAVLSLRLSLLVCIVLSVLPFSCRSSSSPSWHSLALFVSLSPLTSLTQSPRTQHAEETQRSENLNSFHGVHFQVCFI